MRTEKVKWTRMIIRKTSSTQLLSRSKHVRFQYVKYKPYTTEKVLQKSKCTRQFCRKNKVFLRKTFMRASFYLLVLLIQDNHPIGNADLVKIQNKVHWITHFDLRKISTQPISCTCECDSNIFTSLFQPNLLWKIMNGQLKYLEEV